MNNYSGFTNFEPRNYDKLKLSECIVRTKMHDQIDEYLDFCANVRKMSRMTMHAKELALRHLSTESGCESKVRMSWSSRR